MRILLVEDNEPNRDMLSRRLRRRGHTVAEAADGHSGVRIATTEALDIILMDVGLPDISGYEAIRQIRATPGIPRLPVIILTAYATDFDRQQAFWSGADEFQTKPVDLEELCRVMDQLVARAPAGV